MNFEDSIQASSDNDFTNVSSAETRTRRSNTDRSGKIYQCELCDKSYLSAQALNLHRKTKHPKYVNQLIKKRGRNKQDGTDSTDKNKEDCDSDSDSQDLDAEMLSACFEGSKEGDNTSLAEIDETVAELESYFKQFASTGPCRIISVKKHPIVENLRGMSGRAFFKFGAQIVNDIFAEFLEEASKNCAKEQFSKLLKLTLLLADCANNKLGKKNQDFCSTHSALEIPTVANDFIIDYMKKEKSHFGCNKNETIGFVFKICYWLYCKDYTDISLRRILEGEKAE